MGYYTRFEGELTIDPPIPWKKAVAGSPSHVKSVQNRHRDVVFRMHQATQDLGEGVLVTQYAVALVPAYEDASKSYDIVDHVQEAVDAFPDHTFSGRIECAGEEVGDLWRLEVHDRRAVRVEPRLVWPGDDD